MPQMGVSVAEGTVVEWRKAVGDPIERDEVVCAISTDKIDTDVEAPVAGTLAEILVQEGETVEVGTALARIATGDGAAVAAPQAAPASAQAAPAPRPAAPAAPGGPRATYFTPVVRRIAAEHGIDLETVQGSGRGGRVRKQDVLALVDGNGDGGGSEPAEAPMHIESPYRPDPEPAAEAPPARRPRASRWVKAAEEPAAGRLSRMRRTIGERMLESLRTTATCTTIIEVDMSAVEAARAGRGLTALPFVAQAVVGALREFPALNATLDGEDYTRHAAVNLGIAVSLGEEGLIVPVVHDAQQLSVEGLGERIRDLARRARGNQLKPDDVRGGTFTITNPGQYGSILATPVINQPQVAILDTEATVKRAVVITGPDGTDAIAIRPMAYFCLSWDHRALDGAEAARFLAAVRERVERAGA